MSTLNSYINPATPPLKVGQVVAYDYLYSGKTWQWTLGTVRELKEYTAVVQQWALHTGNIDTLRSILSSESEEEEKRMKDFMDLLAAARSRLASIRRSNEDRVSVVRDQFDKARLDVETIDEVALRKVTAQLAPSPVAVAVLKAALAVSKCDPTAVEFFEWADVQMEFRKADIIDIITRTDVLAKLYPSAEPILRSLEQDPKLNSKAATRDSAVVANLHAWVTTALAYQQAYSNLAHDRRIQEQNDAIASAIAGMKACRAKIATLKDELSAKNSSARPGQVTSFTKTSVQVPIALSSVICPMSVDGRVEGCVLTNDEVARVLADAKATRHGQKHQIHLSVSRLLTQFAAATTTQRYAEELEERLYFTQHLLGGALRTAQEGAKDMADELAAFRRKRCDAMAARAADPALAAADAEGPRGSTGSSRWRTTATSPVATARNGAARRGQAPADEDAATAAVHPAVLAQEPLYMATAGELAALRDEAERLAGDIAEQQAKLQKLDQDLVAKDCEHAREVQALTDAVEELEAAVANNAQLQAALAKTEAELGAFRRKRREAKDIRSGEPPLADADAIAAAATSAGRRHGGGATRRRSVDPATVPVDPAELAHEPTYAVILDEYKDLLGQLEQERSGKEALALENDALAGELERAQAALHKAEEGVAQSELAAAQAAQEAAAKDKELAAFRKKRQDAHRARAAEPALAAADGANSDTVLDDAALSNGGKPRASRTDIRSGPHARSAIERAGTPSRSRMAASQPVDPAVIVAEPLYAVTVDEYAAQRAAGDTAAAEAARLADELAAAKDEAEKLEREMAEKDAELAAFRQRRQAAQDARAADPEMAAADAAAGRDTSSGAARDAGSVPVDPATISEEPLFFASAADLEKLREELAAAKDDADRLTDELEKTAEDLKSAKARADRQARMLSGRDADLADRDAELAAFRQKRHDAQAARATVPVLLAADAAASETAAAADSETGDEVPVGRTERPPAGDDPSRSTASRSSPHSSAGNSRGADAEAPSGLAGQPVDPAVIVAEPLYAVTVDEYAAQRAAGDTAAAEAAQLADELAAAKDEAEKLEREMAEKDAELAAFRQRRQAAQDARAADPEMAAADAAAGRDTSSGAARDAGSVPVDPATISEEPLFFASAADLEKLREELAAAKDDADRLTDELEKTAEDLKSAKARADRQARMLSGRDADLADRDAELAAFRQKRHDAQAARATVPVLLAADAAASETAAAADSETGDEVPVGRTERPPAGDDPSRSTASRSSPHSSAGNSRGADAEAPSGLAGQPVDPAVIVAEPLYAVTVDEYAAQRAAGDTAAAEAAQLADELAAAKDEAEKLEREMAEKDAELAAFRQRRQAAQDARAADPEMAAADAAAGRDTSSGAARDAGSVPVDPATISEEPLFFASAADLEKLREELAAAKDDADRLTDELEKTAEDLKSAKARADRQARMLSGRDADLADRDAELAAFRQKRHDAQAARATVPVLLAADAAASETAAAADSETGDEVPVGRTERPPAGDDPSRSTASRSSPHSSAGNSRGADAEAPSGLAGQPVDPAVIVAEPLYAVTVDEYAAQRAAGDTAAAEAAQLADELAAAKDEAEKLEREMAEKDAELAAFRQRRQAAQDARAADPEMAAADAAAGRDTSSGAARDAGSVPVDPATISEEPVYVATADELEQLRDDLGVARGEAEKLADQLESQEADNEALVAQLVEKDAANQRLAGDLASAEEEKQRLCDDLEAALDELEEKREDYDQLLENLEQVQGLLEASKAAGRSAVDALEQRNEELAELQGELAEALEACKENERLRAQLEAKEKEIAELAKHNELWADPVPAAEGGKGKVTHRFTKIFDGDWTRLMSERPEALKAAFVIDSSNACHVPGDQVNQVGFDHD